MASLRPDVLRSKVLYGVWFGMALGFTFSLFTWGMDAYKLQQIHGLAPWLKFLAGAIPCTTVGALVGWLSVRLDKPILAMILWLAAAIFFAWLAINLPFRVMPRLLGVIEPDIRGLLHYSYYEGFSARLALGYFWVAIFMALAGLIQLPMSDSAVFSTSILGKISPMLVVLILMAIAGSSMDNFSNESLRSPVEAVDSTVQYFLEHQGQKVEPQVSRQLHLASLRTVADLVTPERAFVISGYNEFLEQVDVLGRFEQAWVECQVFSNQVVSCKQVGNASR